MAYFLGLILLLATSWASAVIPMAVTYNMHRTYPFESGTSYFASREAGTTSWCAWYMSRGYEPLTSCTSVGGNLYSITWYGSVSTDALYESKKLRCPDHSTNPNGTDHCVCDTGYVENVDKTACVPPPDKCDILKDMPYGGSVWADFGIRSRENYLTLSGTQTTTCAPEGCRVSGTVGGCGRSASTGRTFCDIENGKFTGTSCEFKPSTDEPPPGDNPDDDEPDNKPPAPCPTGKCHGEVNGVRVCVPCGETNDPPPKPPTPPSSDAPPSSNPGGGNNTTTHSQDNGNGTTTTTTTTNSSGTNCTGDKCTTTTTSTTTSSTTDNATGKPTKPPSTSSSTQQTEESRDDFCRKNPSNVACKGNTSTFGGSCGGPFVCEGDAIQCAIARDQLRRNCQAFEPQGTEEERAYGAAKGQTGVQTGNNPHNATFDVSGFNATSPLPTSGSGVKDLTVNIMGQSVTLPFSVINDALGWMGNLLIVAAWIAAYRIVTRGGN